MRIILLRHLETVYSREHRICGQTDCSIIPGEKLWIPEEIMQILHTEGIRIYTSPLKRCLETTDLLRQSAICLETIRVPEFSERDWGPLTGMTKTQVLQLYGMNTAALRNSFWGIKSDKDFSDRVHRGISRLSLHDASTMLIVSHQGCLRIICDFFGTEYKKFMPGEFLLVEK